MSIIARRGIHYMPRLNAAKVSAALLEKGKELQDARVLTDVGDVPIQEIRDCGVDDHRLMNVIGESVKLVMEEVGIRSITAEGRAQAKKFGVEQYEMRTFSRDCHFLENLFQNSARTLQ
ncbi:Arginase 1 [Spatholobus suberectus]|nr:Arginase 1 [Spatholobus suberectus]